MQRKNAKEGKSKCKIWMLYLKKTLKELLLWFVLSATESRHPLDEQESDFTVWVYEIKKQKLERWKQRLEEMKNGA